MRTLIRRLWYLLRLSRFEADLAEEMDFHREMKERELARPGQSPSATASAARRALGSAALARDRSRDVWLWPWLDGLRYDLRLAFRGLRRDRTFAVTALATLALAIALNATSFTIVRAMLFRGFPLVKQSDRLVFLQERYPSNVCCISHADFEDWRAQARTLDGLAYVGERNISFRDGDGRPLDTLAFTVSANTFGLLGVAPTLGRDFAPADEDEGAAPVVILNYRFWESRFGKRTDAVGSTVHVSGEPATIIGVMPERFDFPTREDIWIPLTRTPQLRQRGLTPGGFTAVGRLRDGVTPQEARAELEAINRRLEADYPATNRNLVPTVVAHWQMNSGACARIIWGSVWAGAWFVLFIACANLANLVLVRTLGRWREFSTRMALGAGRGRMIRQVLLETLTLAGAAAMLGWWITRWAVDRWVAATFSRYQVLDYTVDSGTLSYLVATALLAALLVSLAPIGRILQLGDGGGLKGDARGVTQGLPGRHLSAALVSGQMALAMVLLCGAGVLVRSFVEIVGADSGVHDPGTILVGTIRLPSDTYPLSWRRFQYFDRLVAQLGAIPGIEARSIANSLPVSYARVRTPDIEGRPSPPEGEEAVGVVTAGPAYFQVVGASAISGRHFHDGDRAQGLPVAIVNESFAARYWPGEPPVGKRLRLRSGDASAEWRVVVGVVPNIMQGDPLRQTFKPVVYIPFAQDPPAREGFFLARTSVPPGTVERAVRTAVESLDPDVPLTNLATLKDSFAFDRDFMDPEHSELGKHASVAPVFAVIALLLAAIGLGAVIAHSVAQRTNEIGIRMAIGAAAKDVRRLILREGMIPVAAGIILGLAVSTALNRILQSQLVGVSPYDPTTMVGAPLALIAVALTACQAPLRRATAVDPVIALKQD